MNISSDTQIGEVVKHNFKTASLFQANNIDFCCGGKKTIQEACVEAGVETSHLIAELTDVAGHSDPDSEYINQLNLSELCNYIIKRHHSYVRTTIPFLLRNLDKISDVHGKNHPELLEVNRLFGECAGALTMHMQKEEMMLFPYIQLLEEAQRNNVSHGKSPFGTVANPISAMIAEHQTEGERFDSIASLTDNYRIPEDACTTYEVTLKHLRDFEDDLHRHIHLENNILFPKAIELEKN